jgi:hypothetical protein
VAQLVRCGFFGFAEAAVDLARASVSSARAASWVVKALVEATPISGPARVMKRRADSRTMADSGTLQMARVLVMPRLLACLRAARVSAVSPDWEMTTTRVSGSGTDSR